MAGRLGNTDTALRGRRRLAALPPPPPAAAPGDAVASPIDEVPTRIPVTAIAPHPLNPRGRVTGGVDDLAASIRELGVLEPVVVASREAFLAARPGLVEHLPSTAAWVLVAGERRLAAAALAGLSDIPAVSGNHLMAQALDVEAMVVENIQRENLTALQEAQAFQSLTNDGLSQRIIAKRVGRNQSHVARRLSLLRLPPDALGQIETGDLTIVDALILAGARDDDLITAAWDHMLRSGMAAHQAVGLVVAHRERARAHAEAIAAAAAAATAEGTPLLSDDDDVHYQEIDERDVDAIGAARAAGALVAEATEDGLIYYDTSRPSKSGPSDGWTATEKARRAAEQDNERARKAANKARRSAAAVLAGKPPAQSVLADHLVTHTITTAHYDSIRVAAKLVGTDEDPHTWRNSLAGAAAAERRRAAWAISLAHQDIETGSTYHRWGRADADFLNLLATGGYQITDHDRQQLADDTDEHEETSR